MNLVNLSKKHALTLICLLVVAIIIAKNWLLGDFGALGHDSDDGMRLAQIRDFVVGGQAWFDTDQYRLGPIGGTDMHWSRIADIPVIMLISLFDIFLSYEMAEKLAISLWPPLSAIIVLIGVYRGCSFLAGRRAGLIGALIVSIFLVAYFRFDGGAIDHHNIQIGLICVATGFMLDPLFRARSLFISAVALGLSFSIGPEVYFIGAIICAYVPLCWAINGEAYKSGTIAFGAGFALSVGLAFFATIAPAEYGLIRCDGLSLISVCAAIIGGSGLVINAYLNSNRPRLARIIGLCILALISGILFIYMAPACLSNPLNDLPIEVKTLWLENISEAQPLLVSPEKLKGIGPLILGPTMIAMIVCGIKIKRGIMPFQMSLLFALIGFSIALTFYQVRFHTFGLFLAFFPLAIWINDLYGKNEGSERRYYGYIGALALAIPQLWSFGFGMILPYNEAEEKPEKSACLTEDVMEFAQTLPISRIAGTHNFAAKILTETDHSVLSGNYHRNIEGISSVIKILSASPDVAKTELAAQSIDIMVYCKSSYKFYKDHKEDGLAGQLMDGQTPAYLELIKSFEDGDTKIFRFNPEG